MGNLIWETITDAHDAPTHPGVYVYWKGNKILYIGKAISLRARLLSHAQNAKLDAKEAAIVHGATVIRYTLTDNDFFALLLESKLINAHQPPYNLIAKDDRSYLYVTLNLKAEFPKPRLVRGNQLEKGGQIRSFGPFPSTAVAEEILKSIRRLIPFCQQNNVGKRVCFYSHVGLCGPCPSEINKLEGTERTVLLKFYRSQIYEVIRILEGKTGPVITSLTKKMERLSRQQRYEEALGLRKKIERFQYWIDTHAFSDKRILVINDAGEKVKSLQELLKPYLGNSSLSRIECFDASNLLFQHSVVSLVVMNDGRIDKSQYRRFRIRNPQANSDFSRLEEALTRRFHNRWPRPDLLLLDGGKPQVRMAIKVLDRVENAPPLIGLAKAPDRLVIPKLHLGRTTYITVHPETNNSGFNLLKLLRDESHRFANSYRDILQKRDLLSAPIHKS